MGIYLNSESAYTLYKSETQKPYFVDKSQMIEELFPLIEEGANHICITRPRRFGKTVMANMISAFFSRAREASDIFDRLKISASRNYSKYRNQYNVIHISLNDISTQCTTYREYITRIEHRLVRDLKKAYPQAELAENEAAVDALMEIYTEDSENRFIFVFDEWDFLFHQPFVTEQEKREYLSFLRSLLKDRPYVILAYMTGILPIAKYSSGSELNMFTEYTMLSEEKFSEVFGFTDSETDSLYQKYTDYTDHIKVTREGLRYWYNGYHTFSGERVYNPRSVVCALRNNNLGNYWTSAGPYDEIYYYIENNVAAVMDDLALMISGIPVPAKIREYAATSMNLNTKDEIFSSMVVYGFLSYENGKVSIPNKELMDRFDEMLQRESSLGYVYRLAQASDRMLEATLGGDVDTMAEIFELAHNTEVPLFRYNNETELSAVVNLVYLSARDRYRVEREDKAGTGYVDFIFYPETDKSLDCIILELKVDSSPEEEIRQIKTRKYDLRFRERIGEEQKYTGRILAVGIAYNKKEKKHICRIEVLRD